MAPALLVAAEGRSESAMLAITHRRSFDQRDRPRAVFLTQIKMAVGVRQATFAEFLFVLPAGLACFEVLAGPAFTVGVAIKAIANKNDSTVMIYDDLVRIDLFHCELSASFRNLKEIITIAVTGSN